MPSKDPRWDYTLDQQAVDDEGNLIWDSSGETRSAEGGTEWFTCDLSGFNFPKSEMVRQRGLLVARRFADKPGGQTEGDDPRTLNLDDMDIPDGL